MMSESALVSPSSIQTALARFRGLFADEGRPHTVAFLAVLLLGIAIRLYALTLPLGHDETRTFMDFARQPLAGALSDYRAPNNHLFHTLFVHLSYRLFGASPLALRLPAFLAGVLLMPATYGVGRRLYTPSAGLLAMAFVSGSSSLVQYSAEARGYTLGALLFLLQLLTAFQLVERPSRRYWMLLALLAALALWTVPTMLYGVVLVNLWLCLSLWLARSGRERTAALGAFSLTMFLTGLLTVILYLPVFVVSGVERVIANDYVAPTGLRGVVRGLPGYLALVWDAWHGQLPAFVSALLLLAFFVGVIRHRAIAAFRVSLLIPAFVLPIMLILQRVLPYERIWLFLLPAFYLIAASGFVPLLRRVPPGLRQYRALAVALGVPAISLVFALFLDVDKIVSARAPTLDAEAIAIYLQPRLSAGDHVLIEPTATILRYYFFRLGMDESIVDTRDKGDASNLYIVVPRGDNTIQRLIENARIVPENYSEPQFIAAFDHADLVYLEGKRLP